jgi:enterochelin esterase-like enzyme
VPHGRVSDQKFKSKILGAEYPLTIYTPPGYQEMGRRCWLLVAFDGGFPMMENTLDNLLAAGKISPLVVVGVHNISGETRERDLNCSDRFASFLANELVPWARKSFRVYVDPPHTIVGGISLGGLMAVYCGLKQSRVFGKVLADSPSVLIGPGQETATPLWEEEDPRLLARQFAGSPRLPVEFYLEAGRYETYLPVSLLSATRRLRDVLEAKGYRVTYAEFVGGHNEVCWRGSFADAVMALTARQRR